MTFAASAPNTSRKLPTSDPRILSGGGWGRHPFSPGRAYVSFSPVPHGHLLGEAGPVI